MSERKEPVWADIVRRATDRSDWHRNWVDPFCVSTDEAHAILALAARVEELEGFLREQRKRTFNALKREKALKQQGVMDAEWVNKLEAQNIQLRKFSLTVSRCDKLEDG
jgi:hypothetical protein